MTRAAERLARLGREHPEWRPWLAVLDPVVRAADDRSWDDAVPGDPVAPADGATPLVEGTVLTVDAARAAGWLAMLLQAAGAAAARGLDAPVILEASIAQDGARLAAFAEAAGLRPAAFRPVAELAAMPLLHACRRRWAPRVDPAWTRGVCPVCGAWPLLAEARGVERTRRLRCGRCGADWAGEWLRCVYCDTRDHTRLGALVSALATEHRRVEVCEICRGYVKTLTTLQGSPPAEVLLDDLASVDLDVPAVAEGYRRPEARPLALSVRGLPGSRLVARP